MRSGLTEEGKTTVRVKSDKTITLYIYMQRLLCMRLWTYFRTRTRTNLGEDLVNFRPSLDSRTREVFVDLLR